MGKRGGRADLPLHGGRVPDWLGRRMQALGRLIAEAIVLRWGRDELLRRLSHPFWFQSFGAVMGMDWHSSGITTSVMGALKRGLEPVSDELGVWVCGGRGKHSLKTPGELGAVGERTGLDGEALAGESRLVAKVDNAAVQDGFQVYLHGFVVSAEGRWTVVQQGMAPDQGLARRYHWLSEELESFVDEPHRAVDGPGGGVDGPGGGKVLNLTDRRAADARSAQVELIREGPDRVLAEWKRLARAQPVDAPELPHLEMPQRHDVREGDVVMRRLWGNLAAAAERGPEDFTELLQTPRVGPRTVEALAQVSEVVHGTPARFSDPARFSHAHGGKDRKPFPVPLRVYDETIRELRRAVERAKLGRSDRMAAMERLDAQARLAERAARGEPWSAIVEGEEAASPDYGGRSVFGPAQSAPAGGRQGGGRRRGAGTRRAGGGRRRRNRDPRQLELLGS